MTFKYLATTFGIALVAVVAYEQYSARGGARGMRRGA